VARQAPAKGKARKGSTVTIWASKGPPPVQVPDVVGRTLDEARQLLEGAGLQVGDVFNLPAGPDQVLDQDPDAGSTVPKGTRVNLSAF
jgi:serine/threonine-protein kinase